MSGEQASAERERLDAYFMPYQVAWLRDTSRFKIWEKSRRIGATYVQAYEDVLDAARAEGGMDVWFSSADESAAKEYVDYCAQWATLYDTAARHLGEVVIDEKNDIKGFRVEFSSGHKITGLSSNPKGFRSKGGKLVLDEFAFHSDAEAMWKAARPIVTWGYPVRMLSTYNGKGNRYYRMVSETRRALEAGRSPPWSLHSTTVVDAVAQGLADRIVGRTLDAHARAAWLADEEEACGDADVWAQEYMCQPIDEATAWLPWSLIVSAEDPAAGDPKRYEGGPAYVGMDIGRRRDLTVIWVKELVGDVKWNREVITLKNASFAEQDAALDRVVDAYDVRRICIDQTGIGEKPVEDAKARYGAYLVEGVIFTGPLKQHLATIVKQAFEDRLVRIPQSRTIRESHHAVRKLTTAAGNPRFDADRTEAGHADEFWAHALALHAGEDGAQPAAGDTIEAGDDDYLPEAMAGRPRATLWGRRHRRVGRGSAPEPATENDEAAA